MTLGATLYIRNAAEAVAFYRDAFGMTLGYNAKHDNGSYLHAELEKGGKSVFAVSESDNEPIRRAMLSTGAPTMSLGVDLDNDEELRHAYAALTQEGHVLRPLGELPWSPLSADVVDKFGVCWYLYVSQHKPEGS
jgi:PhnB protein